MDDTELLASMARVHSSLAILTDRFATLESSLLQIGVALEALTDALVEVEDPPEPSDDPHFTLDGPVENAARDQSKPL